MVRCKAALTTDHGQLTRFSVLLFLWLNRKRWPGCWRPAILGAATGTLLYLAAFAAVDLHTPPANIFNAAYALARSSWNLSQADLSNPIQRMLFVGTAVQWRGAMFAGWGQLPRQLLQYIADFPREFSGLTTLLVIVGLALLLWKEASLGWLFLTALLLHWAFTFTYRISDIYVFYLSGYVLMAMLAAYAAVWISAWPARHFFGAKYIRAGALLAILAFGVWPRLAPHWQAVQAGQIPFVGVEGYLVDSQTESVYRVVTRVVDQLPPNAIVFVEWSRLYAFYYAAHIEKGRFDLRFIEPAPHADQPGLPESAIEFIRANIDTHPIFFTQARPEVARAGYSFQPREIWFTQF